MISPTTSSSGVETAIANPDFLALNYSHPWLPDLGDGTYCNPVLYADYSDPDVVRVNDDFYLTASSFNCTPGLPILHSKDLVNWKIINHALKNIPHHRYAEVQAGCGVWAPSIRHHCGKFWIFFPTPDEGIYVTTASHPTGKWSEPHLVQEGRGLIDPCPFWDDDGQAYLVHAYAGSRAGIKHRLRVCPMAPDGSRLLDEGKIVFNDPERHPTLEGPKFLKRDGWYYILAPAGGVETGWQVVLRSRHVYGPYQDKIVLSQGKTEINGPHQGALVDTAHGNWWFIHFQDADVYGRIVHLQPVHWEDGWPLMGDNGEPVLRHMKPLQNPLSKTIVPQTDDEFDGEKLGLQWQWQANHSDEWYSLTARLGWLRFYPQQARAALDRQPNLLLQKLPARKFAVETLLEFSPVQSGEEAGLVVLGKTYAALGLLWNGKQKQLVMRTNDKLTIISEIKSGSLRLRMQMDTSGVLSFGFDGDRGPISLPQKIQAQKGVWIGAKMGLYSLRHSENASAGHADFSYFKFF